MTKTLISLLLWITCCQVGHAFQPPADTTLAKAHLAIGDSLFHEGKFQSCIQNLTISSSFYQSARQYPDYFKVRKKIFEVYMTVGSFDQALKTAERTLKESTQLVTNDSLQIAEAYECLGRVHSSLENSDKGIEYLNKAIQIKEQVYGPEHLQLAMANNSLGVAYGSQNKFKKALHYHHRSLAIFQKDSAKNPQAVAGCLNNISAMHTHLGNYYKAAAFMKTSSEINVKFYGEKSINAARSFGNLANALDDLGNQKAAITYHQKALDIFGEELGRDHLYNAYSYSSLSAIYAKDFLYHKALSYASRAAAISENSPGAHFLRADAYYNMGASYYGLKDYDNAKTYYTKGLKIYEIEDPNGYDAGDFHQQLALAESSAGNFPAAMYHYQKAIQFISDALGPQSPFLAKCYYNMAHSFVREGDDAQALLNFEKALAIEMSLVGDDHPFLSKYHNAIGNIFLRRNSYYKAIGSYQKSIIANAHHFTDTIASTNPDLQNISNKFEYLDALSGKAIAFREIHQKSADNIYLQLSNETIKRCNLVADEINRNTHNTKDRIALSEEYSKFVGRILKPWKTVHEADLSAIFLMMEKSRSLALKSKIGHDYSQEYLGISSKLKDLDYDLRVYKSHLQSQIASLLNDTNSATQAALKEKQQALFSLNEQYDSLQSILAEQYVNYYRLKYQNEALTIRQVQDFLGENSNLIAYYMIEGELIIFIINNSHYAMRRVPLDPDFNDQIALFSESLIGQNLQQSRKTGLDLYNVLLKPIANDLNGDDLIIIPYGHLWKVNFDLLLTNSSSSNNPKDLPYLLKKYSISYGNSAALLFNQQPQQSQTNSLGCLAFSYGDTTSIRDQSKLSFNRLRELGDDLPGSRREIAAVANLIKGDYYFGTEATEKNFKQQAGKYNIIHLALHGEVNHQNPDNSRLHFTPVKDSLEDNFLHSHELFAMNLPTDLTVLTACNTGTGQLSNAEGVMSLGRAFQYAGTKSLLLSSWEVSDGIAPEIIESFYQHLKNGHTKSESIRLAKLDYLKQATEQRSNPYYWGNFYILGNNDPITIHGRQLIPTALWIGLGLLIAVSLVVAYRYRKASPKSTST